VEVRISHDELSLLSTPGPNRSVQLPIHPAALEVAKSVTAKSLRK
jgi:hypothetical protein